MFPSFTQKKNDSVESFFFCFVTGRLEGPKNTVAGIAQARNDVSLIV